jgi:hypothetical protein
MIADNFAVFILTHGRPNNVITYRTLLKGGYTGKIYIICDNEDKTIDEYKKNYGDKVIVFDKAAVAKRTDAGDNFKRRDTVLFARNACFDIARDLGIEYFLQLDDDYDSFTFRFNNKFQYHAVHYLIGDKLDSLFFAIIEFYKSIPAQTVAMGQGGDFVGGADCDNANIIRLRRKAMNSFFCSINRQFDFIGRMNDDVNTYVINGNRGGLFLTFYNVTVNQFQTQHNSGGLTDMYLDYGTYIKSFYTVMYTPSCTKVDEFAGRSHRRLHHRISWNNAVPKIMDEKYCKRITTKASRR